MDERMGEPPVLVHTTDDPEEIRICSLVLSAADIPHTITCLSKSTRGIAVAAQSAEKAIYELIAYTEENREWPPPRPENDRYRPAFQLLSPFIIGCLILLYLKTGEWRHDSPWFAAGAGDSTAILDDGQYFRLVTALTLHADPLHLLSNCVLGAFLLHYLFQLLGNGIGLAALLTAASLANLLNVVAHGRDHHFVGFSTAIFAVIGMLSSLNFRRHAAIGRTQLLMPLMAGLAMLAMVGSEGERTDLGAHFFGLVIGLIAGYLFGTKPVLALRSSFWLQTILTGISLAIFLLAWKMALS
jgi:membrane associated rhomboid family serine protease